MTKQDLKDLKAALFEVEMMKQGKEIPYLEYQDILDIVAEQRATGGKINLSQDAYEFYQSQFHKVMKYFEELEKEEEMKQWNDFKIQFDKDREKAVQFILKQNQNMPWQVRKNEAEIRHAVNMAMGQPLPNDLSYREKLADLMGGEFVNENEIRMNEDLRNQKLIQENFEQKQAQKKGN